MAAGIIYNQENDLLVVSLVFACTPNGRDQMVHPLALNSVCTPRRIFQKTGHTAKVTVLPRMVPDLCDGLSSLCQDDSMHDGNKVIELWL
ncbi:hypothetical protein [Bacillus sp. V5-8f]|uniref:hypothetical protein n=1 Tax=Bacillus sp. V5-8f TaxID=2053044 RepID=UPI000C77B518|nr:hypothetical protein [Bacillus sp. V5-8f]PLT33484.1 hypothetical protein CUU64_12970 [Bacillus sp. V5-8f]